MFLQERAGAKISLDDAVSEAIAYLDAGDARVNLARVKRYLASNYPRRWPDAAVESIYDRRMKTRSWLRQDAREAQRAAAMTNEALRKRSGAIASQAAAMRRKGDPRAPIWMRRAGIYAAEEVKRAADEERRCDRRV